MIPVSAVIVAWNSEEHISPCIHAVKAAGAVEIIVVDNGSTDSTRELAASIPGVKLLHFPENAGFAGGANRGVAAATSNCVLILNPDCLVQSGLQQMALAAQGGAAGGMLIGEDGSPQLGFTVRRLPTPWTLAFEVLGLNRLWPSNPVNRRFRCADFDPRLPQQVEQPPGAFLMVNKEIFTRLGGMDEEFWPIWFEDVDFCKRLLDAGYQISYCPAARARHEGAASIRKILWPFKELAWYGSLLRYATRHFGWSSRRLVSLAVAAASVPRVLTGILSRHQGVRALSVYADVLHLALSSLVHGRVDYRRTCRRMEGAKHL